MTKEEYNSYVIRLEPYMGMTDLIVYDDPIILYTLESIEPYEAVVNVWPKAIFRGNNGKIMPTSLNLAVEKLGKGKR